LKGLLVPVKGIAGVARATEALINHRDRHF
jgi:hypothetical protein